VLSRRRRGNPDGSLPPVALPPRGSGALWRLRLPCDDDEDADAAQGALPSRAPLLLCGLRAAIVRAKVEAAEAAVRAPRQAAPTAMAMMSIS
jgi:hypothetical protein